MDLRNKQASTIKVCKQPTSDSDIVRGVRIPKKRYMAIHKALIPTKFKNFNKFVNYCSQKFLDEKLIFEDFYKDNF